MRKLLCSIAAFAALLVSTPSFAVTIVPTPAWGRTSDKLGNFISSVGITANANNTIASTASELNFQSSGRLPANWTTQPSAGRNDEMIVGGTFSALATTTPTIQIKVHLDTVGGTTLYDSGIITGVPALTDAEWQLRLWFGSQALGSTSGRIEAQGLLSIVGLPTNPYGIANTSTFTYNTLASHLFIVTAQHGVSDAGNTISLRYGTFIPGN
jgi:hypothetical protein